MKSHILLAVGCCLANTALAGGPVEPAVEPTPVAAAPAPAAGMDWTGFYVGLSAFQGSYSNDGGETDVGDTDGFGLQAGYLRDLGSFVVGGELAYVRGNYEFDPSTWTSTRLKLIGGYDAGAFLPYGFVGVANYDEGDDSDSVRIYGIGARYAISPRLVAGLEYLVQEKDDFAGFSDFDLKDSDLSLRLDYRF